MLATGGGNQANVDVVMRKMCIAIEADVVVNGSVCEQIRI